MGGSKHEWDTPPTRDHALWKRPTHVCQSLLLHSNALTETPGVRLTLLLSQLPFPDRLIFPLFLLVHW